jgi:hydroxymethylpyrimidine/phosphomethylpyrimidine kinase
LTIAGSDPSGGAGLQADLKTFHQHRTYGMSVVTLITVQNTQSVRGVTPLDADLVASQLEAVLADIPPAAVKTGALGGAEIIRVVAARLRRESVPLVVDPVMISKHGATLLGDESVDALRQLLLPAALLVTPNLAEAARLADMSVTDESSMVAAAAAIAESGVPNVLIKGGHRYGDATDILWSQGAVHRLPAPRLETRHTHGTGCVLSAAVTARLAQGDALVDAVERAKRFVTEAIRAHPGLGHGYGPLNLLVPPAY